MLVKRNFVPMSIEALKSLKSITELNNVRDNHKRHGLDISNRDYLIAYLEINTKDLPSPFERDCEKSILAFEQANTELRGKPYRAQRTRNKVANDGYHEALKTLIAKSIPQPGFKFLVEHGLKELTFESVALRHQKEFTATTLEQARKRLDGI